jgi:hypothetical protein
VEVEVEVEAGYRSLSTDVPVPIPRFPPDIEWYVFIFDHMSVRKDGGFISVESRTDIGARGKGGAEKSKSRKKKTH